MKGLAVVFFLLIAASSFGIQLKEGRYVSKRGDTEFIIIEKGNIIEFGPLGEDNQSFLKYYCDGDEVCTGNWKWKITPLSETSYRWEGSGPTHEILTYHWIK